MEEDRLVAFLLNRFPGRGPGLEKGIGDDAAIIRLPRSAGRLVITTDMLVEEVDFRRSWISARQLGWKSLAVNLSDLAAMGAKPRWYLVAVALPAGTPLRWIRSFYEGLTDLSRLHKTRLIGGDFSSSPSGLQITITVLGQTPEWLPILRSGARPGDHIYVTGRLGRSAAGLRLLLSGAPLPRSAAAREALGAHRTPAPRCEVGAWLARRAIPSAMMDISDGLALDLRRLCKSSGTGAEIWQSGLPLFQPARRWGLDPLDLALHGGEDFELLFTLPESRRYILEKKYPPAFPPLHRIGVIRSDRRLWLRLTPWSAKMPLKASGFDHFKAK